MPEPHRPWGPALLLGASPGRADSDLERCRSLREQQEQLAAAAMQAERILVRQWRKEICPEICRQAEGANAN